mgnify:CR=1 FL=1
MHQNDVQEVREQVRRVLTKSLVPKIESSENTGVFCREVHKELGALGLAAPILPEAFGGADNPYYQLAVAEEMGYFNNGFGLSSLVSTCLFGGNVARHGTEIQKKKYLPDIVSGETMGCWALTEPMVGSDAVSVQSKAYRDGDTYTLNGVKTFITNAPISDVFLVIAREVNRTGEPLAQGIEGGTVFLLERNMPGLRTGLPFKKMGHRSSPTGEIFLENVKVHESQVLGKPGKAFYDMKHSLDVERVVFSGLATGMMQFCVDRTLKYTLERTQFGQPIANFQMIQDKLAQMVVLLETAREYLYLINDRMAKGEKINLEAAITKLVVAENTKRVTDMAVQCHGGYGYMAEYEVERCLRDAKLFEIGAGTSEILKLIIAKQAYKNFQTKK